MITGTDAAPLQVLVVEDDPGDVALVESAFTEYEINTELHHVGDGAEALAFLRREDPYIDAPRPDLSLLDLNMPPSRRPAAPRRDQGRRCSQEHSGGGVHHLGDSG